jgi:multicomponent Na+:H+ antiporter subunit D
MTWESWLPLLTVSTSLVAGSVIFFLGEEHRRARSGLNLAAALLKLLLVGVMLWGVFRGREYETRLPFLPGLDLLLRADSLSLFFATLSSVLWLLTTLYAFGYLEGAPHRSRFFGFFALCVTATVGNAFAGNLFTFFLFYELLTLTTYPLVVHRGTAAALRAGNIYLAYTLAGGAVLLFGVVWLHALAGPVEFVEAGALHRLPEVDRSALTTIFFILIAGLGVKAALVPLHGWLPTAMVAPAPVSALLHAVAVVKAGAFGIVRVLYDVYGIRFAAELGVTGPLAAAAAVTILYGSLRALTQDDLKRRLAFSTVSQVSYIVLGAATVGPLATIGGIVHLVHQGLMKITLFFCAGNIAETLHLHRVSELNGVGRRMPWTMAAFTAAAFGMIGTPPLAGFITKWYLGVGALEAGQPWVILVLVASTGLNAAYFLPILHAAWFRKPDRDWEESHPRGRPYGRPNGRLETRALLLFPSLASAALAILAGLLAGVPFSPLEWAKLIAAREWYP